MAQKLSIIGGGLVGSLFSCYMQKKDFDIKVYESRNDIRKVGPIGGKSINLALSKRGWTALEQIGLREMVEKISIPMYGRTIHQIDGTINYQPYGMQNEAIYSVSRGELNLKMIECADRFDNVEFIFNKNCKKVDIKSNTFEIVDTTNNNYEIVKSDLIFGSDGAFSKVRLSMQKQDRFDYNQFYINYGFKELQIPSGPNNTHLLNKNSLHIWPRKDFMLIALPNIDGSFTCTLFVPFEGENAFDDLTEEKIVEDFFIKNFPDAIKLMPTLIQDFFNNPTSSLVTVRCYPWHYNNTVLIGDAAHAVVPFFGQGMNCGFEDVRIFNELHDKYQNNYSELFIQYEKIRKNNADAISQMALDNFIEMRDLVSKSDFLRMKKIENLIMNNPYYNYTSMYQYVSFTNEDYNFAYNLGKKQNKMLENLLNIEDIETKIKNSELKNLINI